MNDIDPDYIYYDLINTNYQSTTTEPLPLSFTETRNSTFLNNPSNYNLSIVRFQLDTFSLPSYIASIQPNQSDTDLMIHSINLSYMSGTTETTIAPTYLRWVPVNKGEPIPAAPSTSPDGFQFDTPYYYGYSFTHIAEIINTAFTAAMITLKATVGGLSSIDPPFMHYDETLNIFTIIGENPHFDINQTNHIRIYFNRPLFGIMSSFPSFRYPISNANNNIYHLRLTTENGMNIITKPPTGGSSKYYIKLNQEFSTISNITPVSSIVFTTTLLPIVSNKLSAPLLYNNGTLITNANNADNSALIITDISSNDGISFKPNLIYNPSAEYRRISLNSNRPLNALDVQVYWRNKKGKLIPFYLWSGASASIKILFERKK